MLRKIKIFPAPHVEIRVSVSEEMVKDYRACEARSKRLKDDEVDYCENCSWRDVEIENTGVCELKEMEQLLERSERDGTINA